MEHLPLAVLVFARAAGMMAAAPGFGLSEVPLKVRLAAAAALVPVMAPVAQGSVVSEWPGPGVEHLPLLALKEAVVGLGIGFAASLLFYGIGMAGQLVARQLGFLGGSPGVPSAIGGSRLAPGFAGPIGRFYYLLGILTYFMIDGHHWLVAAGARAYERLPVDALLPSGASAEPLTGLAADMFVVAVQVGAPAVAALFLVDVAVAALGRGAPAFSPLGVGLPVRCGVGLVAIALSAPLIGAVVVRQAGALHRALLDFAGAL